MDPVIPVELVPAQPGDELLPYYWPHSSLVAWKTKNRDLGYRTGLNIDSYLIVDCSPTGVARTVEFMGRLERLDHVASLIEPRSLGPDNMALRFSDETMAIYQFDDLADLWAWRREMTFQVGLVWPLPEDTKFYRMSDSSFVGVSRGNLVMLSGTIRPEHHLFDSD